jgi:hypothetical protein
MRGKKDALLPGLSVPDELADRLDAAFDKLCLDAPSFRRRFIEPFAQSRANQKESMVGAILLIILILLLIGALPRWPYSSGWGYYPSGGLGLVFLIVLILLLFRLI